MPRTCTPTERTTIAGTTVNHYLYVFIEDPDGVMRDCTALGGLALDLVDGATWGETLDSPVMTGQLMLRRDTNADTLAPLMGSSSINRNALAAYAVFLEKGRKIQILTATVAGGVTPVSGDKKEMFFGRIDRVQWQHDPVLVDLSDQGAWVSDAWIQAPKQYIAVAAPGAGPLLGDVIQGMLNDISIGRTTSPTLYQPVPATFQPYSNTPTQPGSLLAAIRALAQEIGWDCRYRYDASGVSRLTLYDPNRANTTADWTIGPSEYRDVTQLETSIANIRNYIKGYYNAQALSQQFVVSQDTASQAKYGLRFMQIASSNLITQQSDMQALTDAVLSDLSEASADQEIEMPYFWPVQLGDLITFSANGDHYDSDQKLAVVGYQHKFANGEGSTTIQARGKVAGAFKAWLRREGAPDATSENSILRITPSESTDGTTAKLALVVGAAVDSVHAYYRTVSRDTDPKLAADFSDTATLPVDGTLVQAPVNVLLSFAFPQPPRGKRLVVRLVPWYLSPSGTYVEGEGIVFPVEPAPPGITAVIHATKAGNLVSLSGTLTVGASDVPGTFQIIETVLGVDTTLLTLQPVTGNLAFDSGSYPSLANRVIPAGAEKVTWKAIFTDSAGQAWPFDGFTALPSLVNVQAVPTEAAGVGTVTATITDAAHYLDKTHVDGAVTSQVSWHVIALGVVTIVPSTTVPGGGATSGVYTLNTTLDPLHPIQVAGFLHYVDGSTECFGSWTFDSDKIANVISAVPSIANQIATYVCNFDTDTVVGTGKARFRVDGGSWTTFDVAASYTGTFSFTMNGTSTQSVEVQGQSADGTWGPSLTVPMGTYNSAKTLRVGASEFKYSSGPALVLVNGYIHPATTGSGVYLGQIVGVPHGALITAFRARLYRQTGVGNAFLQVYKIDTSGVPSGPLGGSVLTHSTTGWQTLSLSVSETADGSVYSLYTTLEQLTEPTADSVRTTYAEVDYTVPDVSKPGAG